MIAVVTPVAGRPEHLRRQEEGLRASTRVPDVRVIAAMGKHVDAPESAVMVEVEVPSAGLPLARARNAGAEAAIAAGADLLIFLDVDCIPSPHLIARYEMCASNSGGLLCGAVSYLPPAPPGGYDLRELEQIRAGHPARPVPPENAVLLNGDHNLFWSLSFAVTAQDWHRIGGFCESYVGYGGEDTDLGQRAKLAKVPLTWVGGAWAYHQYHPTADPPVQHVDDIVRNAGIFYDRWGWWPMTGWLNEFQRLNLARQDTHGRWRAGPCPTASSDCSV
jgi:hypothetical protein